MNKNKEFLKLEEVKKNLVRLKEHIENSISNFPPNISYEQWLVLYDCRNINKTLYAYAFYGDKLADYIDTYYSFKNKLFYGNLNLSTNEIDEFRQKNTNNKKWVRCFEALKLDQYVYYDNAERNPIGKKLKSAFIEALIYVVFDCSKSNQTTYEFLHQLRMSSKTKKKFVKKWNIAKFKKTVAN